MNLISIENGEYQKRSSKLKQPDHSLGPDIYTGWQSKSLISKIRQIPLIFANPTIDSISKTLTSFGSQLEFKVVYMGFRPASNMNVFKEYGENKHHNHVNQGFLYSKKSIKRFKFEHFDQPEKYFPIRPTQYRLFKGINPTSKHDNIKFSSQFEGGNLDLAIFVNSNEYDLLMRVDSNTKGHTCWYFFKVFDIKQKKKVKFNIINFSKAHLLYAEGMKPYVFRTSKMQWTQQGIEVEFKNKAIRYLTGKDETFVSKCLSFTYEFENENEEVYFAYSIPYSYSYLLDFLEEIQKKHKQFIKINYDHESTGGIPIPVLSITNFTKQTQKHNHFSIGRLHPGEPQGSWMMEGFIRYLCSPEAHYIREKVQFKIIPMVNVDGVVLGNFRTGIGGRDLNRMFNRAELFNETNLIKKIAQSFKPQIFLDFHGHSAKKNVFIYGPEYKIQDSDYLNSRIYPKIISKKTEAFRYYSCVFKISESKLNTGRALMFHEYKTRFVFTVEASTHGFGSGKDITIFSSNKYLEVGERIAESLQQFVKILSRLPKRHQLNSLETSLSRQTLNKQDKKNKQKFSDLQEFMATENISIDNFFGNQESEIEKELLLQILQNQKQFARNQEPNKSQDQESDSDCENHKEDYTDKELRQIQKAVGMNKSESIDKILIENLNGKGGSIKKSKKIKQSKNQSKKFNTLDVIQNKQRKTNLSAQKEALQAKDLSMERKNYDKFLDQLLDSEPEPAMKNSNQTYGQSKLNASEDLQKDNLRKLNAWKSSHFKNYSEVETTNLQRNKSVNQVYLEGPPLASEYQPLHKMIPKMRSENRNKKEPIFSIKKSFLPLIILKQSEKSQILEKLDESQIRTKERSLISEILQLHEKKKRKNMPTKPSRQYKIAFDQM